MDTKNLNYAFEIFEGMQLENLNYIYRGNFSQSITDNILLLTESNLNSTKENSKIRKRVYSIMVEGLQNITRHQEENAQDFSEQPGIFVIQKNGNNYFITTGNIIENIKIPIVQKLLEKINGLEQDQLKDYYKEVLMAGEFSNKGGAGLGLIEMARKSGNKLSYEFKKLNDKLSYFYLHSGISFIDEELKQIEDEIQDSLKHIITLHDILNTHNIVISFNGAFNQESLVLLLSIIEGQSVSSATTKKKLFYLMVEMLQNIVKHAINYSNTLESGNPGMFLISEDKGNYNLISGNYIEKSKVQELQQKIDQVNNISEDELEHFYNKNLLDFEMIDSKKSGLGIIDLRIKSNHKIKYHFNDIDSDTSFFTIQVTVN
ncbi:MAG: hypothetical protein A2033_08480 [Bacteroidetes bacterium GWA2_31_9]|nr:MAG: hypothetical protein A2033_08480 [Bacteroidetes bacterium GWA2_31_9]